jgi:hypothetical protein
LISSSFNRSSFRRLHGRHDPGGSRAGLAVSSAAPVAASFDHSPGRQDAAIGVEVEPELVGDLDAVQVPGPAAFPASFLRPQQAAVEAGAFWIHGFITFTFSRIKAESLALRLAQQIMPP